VGNRKRPKRPYDDRRKWTALKHRICKRDKGRCQLNLSKRCQPDGLAVGGKPPYDFHLGHVVDWRTNGGSWFSPSNLRAECGACSRAESALRKRREGWKHCDTTIKLVVGPPAGDQSAYAADNATANDLIVDFDAIAASMGSPGPIHSGQIVGMVKAQHGQLLDKVRAGETGARVAWIVSANPAAVDMFPHHELIDADPGRDVIEQRIENWPGKARQWVTDWYATKQQADTAAGEAVHVWEWD